MDFGISFYEELPQDCPPSKAWIPNNETYFRLTNSFPPSVEDFDSEKRRFPEKKYYNECIARAISLLKTAKDCELKRKLPTLKDKGIVIKITLNKESGVILKTGGKNHFSWWRSLGFNPIKYCELVKHA